MNTFVGLFFIGLIIYFVGLFIVSPIVKKIKAKRQYKKELEEQKNKENDENVEHKE